MKLSIITINRNNAKGLKKTIESVLYQTYSDFEYIVIDGASTDNSVELVKALLMPLTISSSWNGRLTWLSEPDTGVYNAMNKGLRMAKGEYVLFLNSADCLASKDVLKEVFQQARNEDLLVGSQYEECEDGIMKRLPQIEMQYVSFDTFRNTNFPHQSTFIKRELLLQVGGYREDFRIISDWAFNMLALFKLNAKVRQLPNIISIYDTTGMSSVEDKRPQWKERRRFLEEEFQYLLPDYDRWDKLRKTFYWRLIVWLREKKNMICKKQ